MAASVALACELWWHKGRQRRQARRVMGLKAARRYKSRRRLRGTRDRLLLDSNSEIMRDKHPREVGRSPSQSMPFERNFKGVQFFRQEGGRQDDNFVVFLRADLLHPDRARDDSVPRCLDADTIVLGEKTAPLRGERSPRNRVLEIVKIKPPKPRLVIRDRRFPANLDDAKNAQSNKALENQRQ